jgi:hypothetical protein
MKVGRLVWLSTVVCVSSCHAWQPAPVPVPDQQIKGTPAVVRVARTKECGPTAGRECRAATGIIRLYNPRVEGDNLIGYHDRANRERLAIPLREVISLESREVDPYRTAGAAIGVGLLVAAVAIAGLAVLISGINY